MANSVIQKMISLDLLIFCLASIFLISLIKSSSIDNVGLSNKANASKILWEIFKRKNEIVSDENQNSQSTMGNSKQVQFNREHTRRKGGSRKIIRKNKNRKQTHLTSNYDFPEMDEEPFDTNLQKSDRHMLYLLSLKNYNSDFMRIKRPKESFDYPFGKLYIPKNSRVMKSRVRHMMRRYRHLPYSNQYKMDLFNKRVKRKIRKFLATYTVCPVRYRWLYKGPKFWPPWIKEGICDNSGGSCSMPPGMSCQESQHENIGVLRYFCMKGWDKSRCGWRKVFIPVLVSCKCSCPRHLVQ